ncbi:MAG: flagellar hook-length control protein FliK [Alphaproteobacteria bacterium]|nr:flagellar hook-length control protein FliK [Alphaproteobacteria bacterium]MDD9919081.1 flagellar hook-length control protein FliK [Alphaproteobacteria bacterium]
MQTQIPAQIGNAQGLFSGLFGGQVGANGALPAGLQGLFAALVAGNKAGEGDLTSLLQGTPLLEGSTAPEGLLSKLTDALGKIDFPADFAGQEHITIKVETLTVQLQEFVVTLEEAGIPPVTMGSAQDLAAALHHQGMPLADALKEAQRIDAALNHIRQKLGLEVTDESSLAQLPLSLTEMVSTTSLTQAHIQVSHVSIEVGQVQRGQQIALFDAQQENAPVTDLLEKVEKQQPLVRLPQQSNPLSTEGQQDRLAAGEAVVEGDVDGLLEEAVKREGVIEKAEVATRTNKAGELVNGEAVEEAPIITARQRVGEHKAPVFESKPVSKLVVDVAETAGAEKGMRVASAELADAPAPIQGTTIYKWQTTKVGMDVVTQVQEIPSQLDGADIAMDMMDGADVDEAEGMERPAAPRQTFAEKMASFARAANIGQQTAPAMKTLIEQGGGQVRLTLNPADLGEIEIDLKIRDGQVQGTIASQNPEVIEQLARELQQLKQGLTEAGYQLGEEGIAFLLQDNGDGQQGNQQDDGTDLAADEASDSSNEQGEEAIAAEGWINPDQLVDVKV